MSQRPRLDQIILAVVSGLQSAGSGILVSSLIGYLTNAGLNYSEAGLFLGLVSVSHTVLFFTTQQFDRTRGKKRALTRTLLLITALTSLVLAFSTSNVAVLAASCSGLVPFSASGLEPLKRTLNSALTTTSIAGGKQGLVVQVYFWDILAWITGAVIAGLLETIYERALDGYKVIYKLYCLVAIVSFLASLGLSCNIEDFQEQAAEEQPEILEESEQESESEQERTESESEELERETSEGDNSRPASPLLSDHGQAPDIEAQASSEQAHSLRGLKLVLLHMFLLTKQLSSTFFLPVWQAEYLKQFCNATPLGASVALAATRVLLCFGPLISVVCLRLTSPVKLVTHISFLSGLACSIIPFETSTPRAAVALAFFALLNVANEIPTTFAFLREMPELTRQLAFTMLAVTRASTVLGPIFIGLTANYGYVSYVFFTVGGLQLAVTSLTAKSLL